MNKMIQVVSQAENREYEVLITLYNNMGSMWAMSFDYMVSVISGKIDLSERMITHYLNKLIERNAIHKVGIVLNDKDGFAIDRNIVAVLKIIQ